MMNARPSALSFMSSAHQATVLPVNTTSEEQDTDGQMLIDLSQVEPDERCKFGAIRDFPLSVSVMAPNVFPDRGRTAAIMAQKTTSMVLRGNSDL